LREPFGERSAHFFLCRPCHKSMVILFITILASRQFGVLQSTAFDLSLNSETVLHFSTYAHDFSNFCGLKGSRPATPTAAGYTRYFTLAQRVTGGSAQSTQGRCWNHCVVVITSSADPNLRPLSRNVLAPTRYHYQKKGSWPVHERRRQVELQRSSPCNP